MCHDDDGILLLELLDQLLDLERGDRVQRRAWLIHQDDLRLDRQRARDAQALLLATREAKRAIAQAIFDLIPQRRATQTALHTLSDLRLSEASLDAQPIGHILEDRARERIGSLEHHTHALTQLHHIRRWPQDVRAVEEDRASHVGDRRQVMHAIERAQEGRFATARRPHQRRHLAFRHLQIDALERARSPIVDAQVHGAHLDRRRYHRDIVRAHTTV